MLTITQRQTAKGKIRYRVEVVKKSNAKIIHRESKTFSTNRLAVERDRPIGLIVNGKNVYQWLMVNGNSQDR